MRKTIVVCSLAGLAVGSLAIYLSELPTGGKRGMLGETQRGEAVLPSPTADIRPWVEPRGNAAESDPGAPVKSPGLHVALAAPATQPTSGKTDSADAPKTARTEDDVVGRPFPVSASVEKMCKASDDCPELTDLLVQFSQQPRDVEWATAMESGLRSLAEAEPDKFAIRGLECRTSLCVIEVASTYGPFSPVIPRDNPLATSLDDGFGDFGYETDPTSAWITVTLLTYKRR